MINSNYKTKNLINPEEDLKKKLLKPKISEAIESTEEIDAMLNSANPKPTEPSAYAKGKADAITGGNYNETETTESEGDDEKESSGKWGSGSAIAKTASAATGALTMASTVMSQKGPMNAKERGAMTMNLAAQGAQAGSAFGPMGTLVGGLAGAGTGLVMGIGDQEELDNKAKIDRLAMLDNTTNERMKAQKLSDGKKALSKNKAILEAQMGMLGSNYSQTKTV